MGERRGDAFVDLGGILDPDPAHADGFRHGREIRVLEIRAGGEETRRFLLKLDETEGAVVEDNDFHRQAQLHQAEEIAHQHGEPAIARQ